MAEKTLIHAELTNSILGCAFGVHTRLGPGLLETAYRKCLVHELKKAGHVVRQEVAIPVSLGDVSVECGFRADLIVDDRVLVELKAVDALAPIHQAQVLSYLRLSGLRVGLLMNFNTISLRQGIKRLVY